MSESDEKLQKGIIELDKGNDGKAFGYFKDVFEDRQERLLKKVQENPKSPTLMLDALYMIHALVWLRVAEAGKDKKHSVELLGKAVGTVESARTTSNRSGSMGQRKEYHPGTQQSSWIACCHKGLRRYGKESS
jgi:hypothetical protein